MAKYIRFGYQIPDYEHEGDLRSEISRTQDKYGGKYVSHHIEYDPEFEEEYGYPDEEGECTVYFDIPEENAVRYYQENEGECYTYSRADRDRMRQLIAEANKPKEQPKPVQQPTPVQQAAKPSATKRQKTASKGRVSG